MALRRLAAPVATVLVASDATPLAAPLADAVDAARVAIEMRRFPDGEAYVRVAAEAVQGHDVVVVHATRSDAELVQLLLMQDAAREAGAASVRSVIPYLGYARQDRAFHSGEAVSSRAVARAIGSGCDAVVTVDPHKQAILDWFGVPATAVSAVDALADALGTWGADVVLAPEKGARERASRAAKRIGCDVDHMEKTRLSATQVQMRAKELDVRGRRVAILDDMIASGGTMREAAKQLLAQGAREVWAACTHGIFTDNAVARLHEAGVRRVLCADTLPATGVEVVSAAPAVATALHLTA
jgi:ribose-phosphate pyrophosphokinase